MTFASPVSSAVNINTFLTTLVQCVVKNEISPRRAAVIGDLTNQIIRTLPAIEHELNPPTDQTPFIFDLPIPYSAQATEKSRPLPSRRPGRPGRRRERCRPSDPAAGRRSDLEFQRGNQTRRRGVPTPSPTPTFSRSQHQPNEDPVYRDPNYDDHWHPTGHLINRPLTTTPNPTTTASPETKQRKPAA